MAGQGGGQRRWCRVTPACAPSAGVPRQRQRGRHASARRVALAVSATLVLAGARVDGARAKAAGPLFIDPGLK